MKRMAILRTAAVGIAGLLLTACGQTETPRETVTLNVHVPVIRLNPDFDPSVVSSYDFLVKAAADFEENYPDADLTIQVIQHETTDSTYFDVSANASDSADILYGDFFNIESYIYTGRVAPLDDIITDGIRQDIGDTFWNMCEKDQKTYMMPFLYRQNVLGYNKELFLSCGLDAYVSNENIVQTWNPKEWEEILTTLKEKLPENHYAMMLYAASNQGDTHIMSFIRSQGSEFFDEEGRFHLNTPEGIAGLSWIENLERSGYCPPGAAKLEIIDNNDLFANGQLAIYVVNDATESSYDFDLGFVNFPAAEGGISTNFNTGFEVIDNGDEQRLAAAKAFIKYIYETDWIDYSSGSIPCSSRVAEKYANELASVQKYLDNADTGVRFTGGNPNWIGVRQAFYPVIAGLLNGEFTAEEAAARLDSDCNAAIEQGYADSTL